MSKKTVPGLMVYEKTKKLDLDIETVHHLTIRILLKTILKTSSGYF